MGAFIDLTGQVFGHLTVKARDGKRRPVFWVASCSCGGETVVRAASLQCGDVTSCGCWKTESTRILMTKHGHLRHKQRPPTYYSWAAMIGRCTQPNHKHFYAYGGRGITICDRWRNSFSAFLEDMGDRPLGMTIERIDGEGNYDPNNCRWATRKEQAANRAPRGTRQCSKPS